MWRPSVGKVGEWYVESQCLQGCSPHLCWLRTDGLAPASKYWTYLSHAGDMGPISLVASCQQKIVFSPLPHWLLWERSWVRTCGSDGHRAADCVWSPSSRGSGSVQICWWLSERLLCVDHVRYIWSGTIRGLGVECVWRVGRVFPYGVYIDLNRCDSQIWASLICDSHHVANLTNLMSLSIIVVCFLIYLIVCNSCMIRVGCTFLLK
jgi:hypothetical protein